MLSRYMWGKWMNPSPQRPSTRPPAAPSDRPNHFPQRVSRRIVRVGWGVIWPWALMLLAGLLLLILRELLSARDTGQHDRP